MKRTVFLSSCDTKRGVTNPTSLLHFRGKGKEEGGILPRGMLKGQVAYLGMIYANRTKRNLLSGGFFSCYLNV